MSPQPTAHRDLPFTQIPDWIILHPEVSHATFRVYAAICRRVGKERTAWPGIKTIAADAQCSESTALTAIKTRERVGAIEVTRRDSPHSNHYYLPLHRPAGRDGRGESAPDTAMIGVSRPNDRCTGYRDDWGETTPSETTPTEPHEESADALIGELVEEDDYQIDTPKAYHDVMAYALVDAMGWERIEVTQPQWGKVHAAAKKLTELGAHPADVPIRARIYQANHPQWELTPTALASWWADSATVRHRLSTRQVADLTAAAERRGWKEHRD